MKIKKTFIYKITHTNLKKLKKWEVAMAICSLILVVPYLIIKKIIITPAKTVYNLTIKKTEPEKIFKTGKKR